MNKSYQDEVSDNLTTFATVGNARRERRCNKKEHLLQLLGLLFVKGHKIEFQRNIKTNLNLRSFVGYTHSLLFSQSFRLQKVQNIQSG